MSVSPLQGEERWLLLKVFFLQVDLSQQTLSKPYFPGYASFVVLLFSGVTEGVTQ